MSFPNRSVQFSNRSQIAYEQKYQLRTATYHFLAERNRCHVHRYAAMYTDMMACTQICCHIHRYADIYTDMLPYTRRWWHIHRDAAIYTDMLPYTQMCCHIHTYVAIYTDMLPYTQICCHIHKDVAMYTDMLPYTQIMHTQICCHIFRYAAMYTNMLPHTDMLSCTQITEKKNASSTKHSIAIKISIFSARAFYIFRFEAVFISLSRELRMRGGKGRAAAPQGPGPRGRSPHSQPPSPHSEPAFNKRRPHFGPPSHPRSRILTWISGDPRILEPPPSGSTHMESGSPHFAHFGYGCGVDKVASNHSSRNM